MGVRLYKLFKQLTGPSLRKFHYSLVFVAWLINDLFNLSVGKQLEIRHLASVFDTRHLVLGEGSLLPKIVGVICHGYGLFLFS